MFKFNRLVTVFTYAPAQLVFFQNYPLIDSEKQCKPPYPKFFGKITGIYLAKIKNKFN